MVYLFISQDNGFVELLSEFQWYKLPIELQRDFKILLSRKQNSATLTIGPFGNINRELFANVQFSEYKAKPCGHSYAFFLYFRYRRRSTLFSCT